MVVYAIVFVYVRGVGFVDEKDISAIKNIFFIAASIPIIFTLFCSKNKDWLISKLSQNSNAPYLKMMSDEDRNYLSRFGGYFMSHIIMWMLNEAGAVIAFILSFISGNFTYYLIFASAATFINLFLFKPDYKNFISRNRFV
jgi:hypothetical protein